MNDTSAEEPCQRAWLTLAKEPRIHVILVNVGQAKTDLSKLLARVEAGEIVEIGRDGVPVARLVQIELPSSPGKRFLAARGSIAGRISLAGDFELTEAELDDMLNGST